MARFRFRALSANGEIVSGELDGPDTAAVIGWLHDQALLPIEAVEKSSEAATAFRFRIPTSRALPGRDLALLTQQLGRLLEANLPLDRALEILGAMVSHERSRRVVTRTLRRVRDGAGLAEAMAAQGVDFPGAYVGMVRAGEAGGALAAVLARLAEFLTRSERIRQKVISAMIYPSILAVVAAGSVALALTVVLPQFRPLFDEAGSRLPTSTWIVMSAGDWLGELWWEGLTAFIGIALVARSLMRRPRVAMWRDQQLLRVPIFRELITKFAIGRFCRTMEVLLTNGVAASRALALATAVIGNRALSDAVETVSARFKEGEDLSPALAATGRVPVVCLQLIRVGEETGRLEEMLQEIADIYDEEVQHLLERLVALLVPGITIVTGLIVALIVVSVISAMISINDLAL